MASKREQQLIKQIKNMQIFLNKVINKINQGIEEDASKDFYISCFEEIESLGIEIQEEFIKESLTNDHVDLTEFLDGMFKRNTRKQNGRKNRNNDYKAFKENKSFEEFLHIMRPYTEGRSSINKNLQSPKFRKFNKQFNYIDDWANKPTNGYLNEDFLSLDDKYIKVSYPQFDRSNPHTYPPKARWIDYADKYSEEFILNLKSAWCFRSALQCFELTMTSREFEFELKKMEIIGNEAVELFIEYCSELGVIDITDNDIDYFKKILDEGEKNE